MKFNEIDPAQWEELKPYLDTCLLPVTGMDGTESPGEATEALERLRDALDLLEIPFKGRIVTYPAHHYASGESDTVALRRTVDRLRGVGFRYVILASARLDEQRLLAAGADLAVSLPALEAAGIEPGQAVAQKVQALWNKKASVLPN